MEVVMQNQVRSISILIFAFVCGLLLPSYASAQVDRGSIAGTVTDTSSASVAAAKVMVTNLETGQVVEVSTDEEGNYSAKLLRILNVSAHVEGGVPDEGDRASMVAANHVSWLDIFVISSARPTRFIAKSEIRDWPIAGWIAEEAGTLFMRRHEWRDTARTTERVHAALAGGDCVGLFPEGLTTEGDTLLKFHSSLFEAAVGNAAHVYPLQCHSRAPGLESLFSDRCCAWPPCQGDERSGVGENPSTIDR
jgi:1-acyl-sn-glycerol-3-phosphate acyltransferase